MAVGDRVITPSQDGLTTHWDLQQTAVGCAPSNAPPLGAREHRCDLLLTECYKEDEQTVKNIHYLYVGFVRDTPPCHAY